MNLKNNINKMFNGRKDKNYKPETIINKTPVKSEKLLRTIEGIFDVEQIPNNYAVIQKRIAEGKILNITYNNIHLPSTAIFSDNTKNISGIYLEIENSRGKEIVEFPAAISLTAKMAMLNQDVKYGKRTWSTSTEGTSTHYDLEVLSGDLKGYSLKKDTFI